MASSRKRPSAGDAKSSASARKPRPPVRAQHSAGGVVARRRGAQLEIALIAVGEPRRWQLPKGLIDPGERAEDTARREVREETGVDAEVVATLDPIDYWYVATEQGAPVRIHKTVDFFLLRYLAGDVANHDREVHEARWVAIHEAPERLAFPSERRVLEQAASLIAGGALPQTPATHS